MNVTKDGFKDRQLHIEGYLQMVSAEQKEYTETSDHKRITERGDIITDFQTDNLMERILSNIIPFIESKFFLKVNRDKTCVAHIGKVKYLGYSFYRFKGKCRFRVHPKSVAKMKRRGFVPICEMEAGIVVDILSYKLHLTIRNSVN